MINEGIINIKKPAGMSSHDVVYAVRRLTGIKRIGHTGTLDPEAFGVLPVCIGTAARIPEYLDMDMKKYRCSMLLGVTSDSQDIWGKEVCDRREELKSVGLLQASEAMNNAFNLKSAEDIKAAEPESATCVSAAGPVDRERVETALSEFTGVINQIPPKYSAVRVDGRRLYDYARKGQDVKIPERTVFIREITLLDYEPEEMKVTFDVVCSKGTYIRTICHELGEKLGVGGAMCSLERLESGFFTLENAVDFERVEALAARRTALIDRLPKTQKIPRGRMNDDLILSGGLKALEKLYGIEGGLETSLYEEYDEIEKAINEISISPDLAMEKFGRAVILEGSKVEWFLQGGHVRKSETEILEEPVFASEKFSLPMRDEFTRAYRLYAPKKDGFEGEFLGVAFYDLNYKKLVADKVFYRRPLPQK